MAFTAIEDDEIVGFFTMRRPSESFDELRFGFVIVDPAKRGKGYGKTMLQLGLKFTKEIYGAKKVSLGVFENNESAYYCYKAVGFKDVVLEKTETYTILFRKILILKNRSVYLCLCMAEIKIPRMMLRLRVI